MKHIIVSDTRQSFLQNLSTYILIEEKRIAVSTVVSIEQAVAMLAQNPDCIIAVCENTVEDAMPGILDQLLRDASEVYGYCVTANGRLLFSEAGIPCIGLVQDAKKLADTLEQDMISITEPIRPPRPTTKSTPAEASQPLPQARKPYTDVQEDDLSGRHPAPSGCRPAQEARDTEPYQDFYTPNRFGNATGNSRLSDETKRHPQTGAEKMYSSRQRRIDEEANRELRRDGFFESAPKSKRAKVVTVYAAKGGVGKTTIAAETAVCLALTNNGRRRFRVCLVDYNIDFGDVITTLNLDSKGASMTHWSNDIRSRIEAGEAPESLWYTREDIRDTYLQYMSKNGLYVLAAPMIHEDSMDIGETELTVMLRNLAENGDFDFVLCDTGNNTRDSSVLALEAADYVLMVATQDVTTANCNDSFIATITKIGFDTTKIRLVVNNVLPTQSTGISVREVEENFPYPCAARIRRDEAVIKANNYGEPLVYNPKHEFTKQIQNIVHFITDSRIVPATEDFPQKEGFLKRLFGKKGAL